MSIERRCTWILPPLVSLGLLATASAIHRQSELDKLRFDMRRCSETYHINGFPMLSYASDCRGNTMQRGIEFRRDECSDSIVPPTPELVLIPGTLNDHSQDATHIMFHQQGNTCYLTCVAAAMSDLSYQHNGPVIDPFYVSDVLSLEQGGDSVEGTTSVDAMNTSATQLKKIEVVGITDNQRFVFEEDLFATFKEDNKLTPETFLEYVAELMDNPSRRVILSARVAEDAYHAVLIVGYGYEDVSGEPYLLVAEPNGGNFEESKNADYVRDDWKTLSLPEGFLTQIRVTQDQLNNVTRLTGVRRLTP